MRNQQGLAALMMTVIVIGFAPTVSKAQETCGTPVAACRNALFVTEDIVAADDACALAVAANPTDGCARIFRAATRMLRVLGSDTDGLDPTTFTDSVKEMLDQFGVPPTGRDIYSFAPLFPRDVNGDVALPIDSPQGPDVQEALDLLVVSAIRDSVADLRSVPNNTLINISMSELMSVFAAVGNTAASTATVEVDFGESKLFESALLFWQSQLLFSTALDLNVDIDSFTPIQDQILIQQEILDAHPSFMVLLPEAASMLSEANQANRGAIAAYLTASNFIRNEQDDQTDDVITFEPTDLANEADVRAQLATLSSSLDAPTPILNLGTNYISEDSILSSLDSGLGTAFYDLGAILDLGRFYDVTPFDVRDKLPAFDLGNSVVDGTLPDVTFGGVLVSASNPPPPAPAGTLDDFEVGRFSVMKSPGEGFVFEGRVGYDPNNVLAGERDIIVSDSDFSSGFPGSAAADLVLTEGNDAAVFTVSGELGTNIQTSYFFEQPPLDLLAIGGVGFTIDLLSLSDPSGLSSLYFEVQNFTGTFGFSSVEIFDLTPGVINVPFNTFTGSADFSQVNLIAFEWRTPSGVIGTASASFDDFRVDVPEPSMALPFGVGLLASFATRRKRGRFL